MRALLDELRDDPEQATRGAQLGRAGAAAVADHDEYAAEIRAHYALPSRPEDL